VHRALAWLPAGLSQRASAAVPMIVVLPCTYMDIDGATFDSTRAVLVFEDEDQSSDEEALTVLHVLAHVLDPGWETIGLGEVINEEWPVLPRAVKTRLNDVGGRRSPFELFAELASWEIAGVEQRVHLPRSCEIVRQALDWGGN
jgi:hypothetical protein